MNKFLEFLKSSGIYFIGNILNKLAIVILLPLYTSKIDPSDYGYYDLTITYITLLTSIIFIDIWTITMREMLGTKNIKERNKYLTNGVFIFSGCILVYSIIIIIFQYFIPIKYIYLVYIYGISICLQNFYSSCIRGFNLNKIFVISGISNTIITLILNIVMLNYLNIGYIALYIAAIIGNLLQIIIIELRGHLIRKFNLKYLEYEKIRNMFMISIPLCLNSAFYWILFNYNRILISYKLGTYENGLYAVGTKFSSILSLVTTCFALAWQEVAFKDEYDKSRMYSIASNLYINLLLIGIIFVLPIINILFPIMIGKEYIDAKYIVPWSLLASVMSIFSGFLGTIFSAIRDNKSIMFATIVGSITNVLLVNILIIKIGVNAASISIFFGFFINVIMRISILKKKINFKFNYFTLCKYIPVILIISYIYINYGYKINLAILFFMVIIVILKYKYRILLFLKNKSKF
ncbi:lipopolysaccharide biosynthesis protein [Clostridium perfringens]